MIKNREEAGRQLAKRLGAFANRKDVTVLGIPRGGIPVAFEIAQVLQAPLDVFLSRKLGVPGQEELAFGAIAAGDGRYLDQEIIHAAGISEQQVERITQKVKETLHQRAALYRGDRPPLQVAGRAVILVDDGIATGASIYAAIHALRQMAPAKLVVAVPVAAAATCTWLRTIVDQLICLYEPERFYAVGQFYEQFSQVDDEEVIDLLQRSGEPARRTPPAAEWASNADQDEVSIDAGGVSLQGTLTVPKDAKGVILFVHGSGSSRHSPRNRRVAGILQSHGFATLLFDLLTQDEEDLDQKTAELRFDIDLLTKRLAGATHWIAKHASTATLAIGYFGASTGAAAALAAAALLRDRVAAIVSRGGRPDLAADALGKVRAPVLLLVGGKDEMVITLNRYALERLQSPEKHLAIIPGATHLFEEPGKLDQVASMASDWFARYLVPDRSEKAAGHTRVSGAR